ncbi:MAG: alpha/beta hydrolase family protein [Eubacteriales bacterium]
MQYNFNLSVGDKNVGTVYLPDENCIKLPVIIYCHGWGGNRSLPAALNWSLEEKVAIVTFDFYGCGDTGGNYNQMTYRRWKENLYDIITWVSEQRFADIARIGCYVFSSGSTAALRLAAEDNRIRFIISVGTCISAHIGMSNGGPGKLLADNFEELQSGGTATIFGVDFPLDFFRDTVSNAPIQTIKNIKCPTLFLQGTADNVYRCADARMAYDLMRYENNPTELVEINGGNHGLDNVADEASKVIMNWLAVKGILVI